MITVTRLVCIFFNRNLFSIQGKLNIDLVSAGLGSLSLVLINYIPTETVSFVSLEFDFNYFADPIIKD